MVWAPPRSLATTCGISFDFFSCGYLDVSVPHVSPAHTMYSCVRTWPSIPGGFPHSDICGSMAICASPQLFAAYHVLLRLLVPRHSPCALNSLTLSLKRYMRRITASAFESSAAYLPFSNTSCTLAFLVLLPSNFKLN